MAKYGVSFTIPSLSIQSAVWYPKDPNYFIQIVNYVIPQDEQQKVHTHEIKKKQEIVQTFEQLFEEKIGGCCIRLRHALPGLNSVDEKGEHFFIEEKRVDQLQMQFSQDGSLFALFSRKNKFLRLYKNNDILNLIKLIKQN